MNEKLTRSRQKTHNDLRDKKNHQAYETLATAEREKTDKNTNAAIPSDIQVENMRDFSIENKK